MKGNAAQFIKGVPKRWPTKHNNPYNGGSLDCDKFAQHASETRPIIHEDMVKLLKDWLADRKNNGTDAEKQVYKDLDLCGLVDRFLSKRAIMFVGGSDGGFLRNGERNWDFTQVKNDANKLKDYMSYDELPLSALVTVSSPVQLVNTGNRFNDGKLDKKNCASEAIYLGQVGARFEKRDYAEYNHFHRNRNNKHRDNGLFKSFYGGSLGDKAFKERFRKLAEVHIRDGEYWGGQRGKDVRIQACALGAGVWADTWGGDTLSKWAIEAYHSVLTKNKFSRVKIMEFNYHPMHDLFKALSLSGFEAQKDLKNGRIGYKHTKSGIMYVFHVQKSTYDGDPFLKQPELIVANYAWDSNSMPGNEYWAGDLHASGDPAAASCSTIWNHQNAHINKQYCNGSNAYVMLKKGGFKKLSSF